MVRTATGVPAAVLLDRARAALRDAAAADTSDERFRLAHMAALRTAGAVVAAEASGPGRRRRLQNVWVRLDTVAPEFTDRTAYFAAGARIRAAIEAGGYAVVSPDLADQQVRAATEFVAAVEERLGLPAAARAVPLAS